jgi:hypothetical protein
MRPSQAYAAKFNADGTGVWLELSFTNPVVAGYAGYAFADQADVCVNVRLAADAVGATKMDRPEWGGVNPANGEIYQTLTNNSNRRVDPTGSSQLAPDSANRRVYTDMKGATAQPVIPTVISCACGRARQGARQPASHGTLPFWCRGGRGQGDAQRFEPDGRPGLLEPRWLGVQPVHRNLLDSNRCWLRCHARSAMVQPRHSATPTPTAASSRHHAGRQSAHG